MEPCIRYSARMAKSYDKLRSALFYNTFVSMMTESYSMVSLCCLIGFNKISFQSSGQIVQTCINFFFFALLFAYPIIITYTTVKRWDHVKELKSKYSSYFEELRIASGPQILIYNNYFLFRRLLMACVVVFTQKLLFLQVMIMAFLTVA